MRTARSFRIAYRSLTVLLMALIILTVLAACNERRAARQREGGASLPPVQETTRRPTATTPTPSQEGKDMTVDRIAYIGLDGNIFTIKADGTGSQRLTNSDLRVGPAGHILGQAPLSQVFYAWPTWSPDSTKLAASHIVEVQGGISLSVEVVDASTGKTTKVYDNEPNTGPIAQNAPHYIYWSPDSNHISFVAATPGELALFVSTPGERGGPVRLMGKAPIYYSWASDSSALLIHNGPELVMASPAGGEVRPADSLGQVGTGFRAPALSRDGSKLVYATGGALYASDAKLQPVGGERILDVGASSAFLWSPTRDEIAVADIISAPESAASYERLRIVSSDGASQRILVNEPLIAFFWSPDGEKIAYVGLAPESRSLIWKYVDRETERTIPLMEFFPSSDFLTLISFFDQYAYSNSIWSPDSSRIVFSGTVATRALRRNGDSAGGDKVYVLDVKEGATPRAIAASHIAFWSWR